MWSSFFSFLALKWPKRAIFGGQGTQKMRFFPFKISKFCFSQSVRIDECIADVVSFSFLFCLKMAIFGGKCSPKMRFSFFKISKFRFGESIRVEEWIMNMQSFFMARPGAQNDHIKWPKFELKCTKFWTIFGQYSNEIGKTFWQYKLDILIILGQYLNNMLPTFAKY